MAHAPTMGAAPERAWEVRQGDALALLRALPDGIVQTCVTSPPYWGLRDYGTATWDGGDPACAHAGRPKPQRDTSGGGPEKGRFAETRGTQPAKAVQAIPVRAVCRCGARRVDMQLGLEPTPEMYVERVVGIFREVRRALRPDGTLWLNLGDSYAASKGSVQRGAAPSARSTLRGNGHLGGGPKLHAGGAVVSCARAFGGLKPKDLVGIPWRVAFALQADGWWLRSDIVWHKPNPMPESVTDRPTKAHEYVFLLSKSERYHYDAEAVAEKATGQAPGNVRPTAFAEADPVRGRTAANLHKIEARETRNRRTVWTITSQPFAGAHFAVMPQALVEPCILAGSRPGDLVLDPFAGAGTVGVVALRHGRRFLGLELNPEYVAMARRRIVDDAPLWNTPTDPGAGEGAA